MPSSSYENVILQIIEAAKQDKRIQPWMEELEDVVNNPEEITEEIISTGGSCDVLKLIFPA